MGATAGHRYQIVEKIGEGGMAEVFKARVAGEDGTVVLKAILPHLSEDADHVGMLVDEARIASTLDHPNIVRFLDMGRMEGRLFIALEYVDGADLRELLSRASIAGTTLALGSVLYVVREVLNALDHAHRALDPGGNPRPIIHRDVSPQNVFVSRAGEVKLGDFGIARHREMDHRTAVGTVRGNALYLSPEAAEGLALDPRADLYQAGLLLMTLLCGRHPAENESIPALVERAKRADVPRPGDYRPELPGFVDDLVGGATSKELAGRFPSAAAFRDTLEAYARSERIVLGPDSLEADLAAALAGAEATRVASASPASQVASLGGKTDVYLEPVEAAAPAPSGPGGVAEFLEACAEAPPRTRSTTGRTTIAAPPGAAIRAAEAVTMVGQPPTTTIWEGPTDPSSEIPHEESTAIGRPPEDPDDTTSTTLEEREDGDTKKRARVEPGSPNERTAIARNPLADDEPPPRTEPARPTGPPRPPGLSAVTPSTPGTQRPVPPATGSSPGSARPAAPSSPGAPRPAAAAPAGPAPEEDTHTFLSIPAASQPPKLDFERKAGAPPPAAPSAPGARRASGTIVNAPDPTRQANPAQTSFASGASAPPNAVTISAHEGPIRAMAIAPAIARAITGGDDGWLRIWDLASGTASEERPRAHEGGVAAIAVSADGMTAVSAGKDRALRVWDFENAGSAPVTLDSRAMLRAVALSGDGTLAIVGGDERAITLWDLPRRKSLATFPGHRAPINALGIFLDRVRILSGSEDGTLRIWSIEAGVELAVLEEGIPIRAVAMSGDGGIVLSGATDGGISVWSSDAAARVHRISVHAAPVTALCVSLDGGIALSGAKDGSVARWDVKRAQILENYVVHAGAVTCVALAPDGKHVLTSGEDGEIRGW